MSWMRRLLASLRARKLENDLEEELAFHLEMRASESASAGAAPEDARRQAIARFGNVSRTKEACREQSTLTWIADLRQDLRYAFRNLLRSPGFTAAAAACMAMGIGANTAIFSFVNAFLFQPLPKGVALVQRASGSAVSYPDLQDWRRLNPAFEEMFGYSPGERFTIGRGAESEHVLGETVAGGYFQSLGVTPAAGRLLAPADESLPLAVIGYRFWQSHFAGDPGVVGKTIRINGRAFSIAGVAPRAFPGMLAPWSTDVWVTTFLHPEAVGDRRVEFLMAGGRLKPGVTLRAAGDAINSLDAGLARQHPGPQGQGRNPLIVARRSGLSGSPVWGVFAVMAVLLMSVAGIIFLIACGNVAGLLVARALVRRREILIRLSLGAGRGRLVRQLLTESMLVGLAGAAAGVGLAYAAGDALAGLMPQSISGGFRFQHGIDAQVLLFTVGLAMAGALISGLAPAFRAAGQDLAAAGRAHSAYGGRTPRLRRFLIVAQVAASVLVLCTAALFVRSFQKAQAADAGFDVAHVLTVDLDLRELKYPPARIAEVYRQVREQIAGLPGVSSAALADVLPFGSTSVADVIGAGPMATATVDSGYFRTMGIPLVRGREAQPGERDVVVVNQALASRLWPGRDPLRESIRLRNGKPQQVIGLTATGKYWSLDEPPRPFVYRIADQLAEPFACLAIRTEGPPASLAAAVGRAIEQAGEDLPGMRVRTAGERLRAWLEPQRSAAMLLSILGLASLGLAITGLYSLLAQLVAQRSAEIAVRMALGATRPAVAGMLLRQSAWLILAGTATGMAVSAAVTRVLGSVAGPIDRMDGITAAAIAALLAAVGAAATIVPAYRAWRIDPAAALRSE